jgi:hypothetical protein
MCGILGAVISGAPFEQQILSGALESLACAAESRGKDSSGAVIRSAVVEELRVYKGAVPLTRLWHSQEVATRVAAEIKRHAAAGRPIAIAGHSRLVTNGTQLSGDNNQPVIKDGVIGIHNGIIVNDDSLWAKFPQLQREYDVDTEVMLSQVRHFMSKGSSTSLAVAQTMSEIEGTVSACLLFDDRPELALFTNCGSLYTLTDGKTHFFFASEAHPLSTIAAQYQFDEQRGFRLAQVASGTGVIVGLHCLSRHNFTLDVAQLKNDERSIAGSPQHRRFPIRTVAIGNAPGDGTLIRDVRKIAAAPEAPRFERLLEFNLDRIQQLKRCTICILPATFPFIEFDEAGVCSYCRYYKVRNQPKPVGELKGLVDRYRRPSGAPDCIVPFSGGRDSTFALHFVKKELGLNPIAFTYDWGMVTDLGRRNIARVCSKLGVENIIVAADIREKRENIRKNVIAWLRRPHLGMVPLFMAGDKYFYYYTAAVRKQTGIDLNIWGVNPLENTDFKVGFLGVPPDPDKKRIYSLNLSRKMRLFAGVGRAVAQNPAYINSSIADSLGSFASRSLMTHAHYYHLFDYVRWDESEVENLVRHEYDWETAIDTTTTWRIGDGTAAFYNYIYCTVAGFSEHDTFRSNQIREGMMTRTEALRRVQQDNRPRYATIKWYTEVIQLDYQAAIERINAIPKLY